MSQIARHLSKDNKKDSQPPQHREPAGTVVPAPAAGAASNELILLEIKKMQEHLRFLEKKVDQVLAQSSSRPQGGPREFSGSRGHFQNPRREGYRGGYSGHASQAGQQGRGPGGDFRRGNTYGRAQERWDRDRPQNPEGNRSSQFSHHRSGHRRPFFKKGKHSGGPQGE